MTIKEPLRSKESLKSKDSQTNEKFDWKFYTQFYEDLDQITDYETAYDHWINHGIEENRHPSLNRALQRPSWKGFIQAARRTSVLKPIFSSIQTSNLSARTTNTERYGTIWLTEYKNKDLIALFKASVATQKRKQILQLVHQKVGPQNR